MERILFFMLLIFFTCSPAANGADSMTLDRNTRRAGGDYTSFSTATARDCADYCQKSSRCQAFDFYTSDHSCWLKSRAYSSTYYLGAVSGAKIYTPVKHPQSTANTTIELRYDTQRPGGDYTRFQVRDARECERICAENSRCAAFDFTSSDYFCYLKSWIPRARYYRGIVSGVKKSGDNQVKAVQEVLLQQQYNAGVADGVMGRKTGLALENYQKDHGLPVTGRIDKATLLAMGLVQSAPAVEKLQSPQAGITEENRQPETTGNPPASVVDREIPKERWPTRAELQASAATEPEQKPATETLPQNLLLQVRTVAVTYMQMTANIYADVLGTIPAGTVLQVISQTDGWYKVSYQNQAGYILAESVEKL